MAGLDFPALSPYNIPHPDSQLRLIYRSRSGPALAARRCTSRQATIVSYCSSWKSTQRLGHLFQEQDEIPRPSTPLVYKVAPISHFSHTIQRSIQTTFQITFDPKSLSYPS